MHPQAEEGSKDGKEAPHGPNESRIYQGAVQPKNFPAFPPDWVSEWETFPSSDGKLQLFAVTHHFKEWKNERVLVILHGLGEHGGRYLHFPHYLRSIVGGIYCLDHRGHGRSEGLRGHTDRFDSYADDAALAISRLDEALRKRFGRSEIHLLGHSMGGLIALRTLFLHNRLPLHSVSISAPLLGVRIEVPWIKKSAAKVLARLWGSFHMTSELDAGLLSHDRDVVEAYVGDRLVHQKVTPRFFTELQSAMADTLGRESGLNYPLEMLIPLQDKIVDSDVALHYFRGLKLRDKLLKTYPDLYHEPFNDIGKEQVFEDLIAWIKSHSVN